MLKPIPRFATVMLTALTNTVVAQTDTTRTPPAGAAAPLSEIIRGFEERGYRLTDIDIDSDVTEVEDLDPNGDRVEAHVDPVSGEVLSETPED